MKYQYILFDMDGTVLETLADILDSLNDTLVHFGLPPISREQCRNNIGNGAKRLIERSVPEGTSPELTEQVLAYYLPWYASHAQIKTQAYPGIEDLMKKIRQEGGRVAIISNKPDVACRKLADTFFSGLSDLSIGQSDRIARKPAPDMLFEAMRILGAKKEECVYIGDSEVDIITAKNAGMDCISVLWGYRTREELLDSGASVFAETAEELFNLL